MKRIENVVAGVLSGFFAVSACAQTGTFIDRQLPSDVRVVTYNVNWDSIFPDNDPNNHSFRSFNMVQEFRRVIAALDPDVMCLQEINSSRNPQDVADIFDAVLPLGGGAGWQATIGYSNVIVSRYPLTMLASDTVPQGQRAQAMALVDLPNAAFSVDLYLINEHYKCCGGSNNDNKRQKQSDAVVNWMRDARTPGESIDLPPDTPIIVLGDLNMVGSLGPLDTLLCGNILDNGTYGPDSPPDWDTSCDTDLHPLHNVAGPADYTWRDDNSSFNPGRLDYIIFTDTVLTPANRFILNTTTMSAAELSATGLQTFDVVVAPPGDFDHLPLVVDLRFAQTPVAPDGDASLDGLTDGADVAWFVSLAEAGAAADPARIPHVDYNANGVVDTGDLPGFVGNLLGP